MHVQWHREVHKWPTTAKSKDLIMRKFCRAALLVCGRFSPRPFWSAAVLDRGRYGPRPFWSYTFSIVVWETFQNDITIRLSVIPDLVTTFFDLLTCIWPLLRLPSHGVMNINAQRWQWVQFGNVLPTIPGWAAICPFCRPLLSLSLAVDCNFCSHNSRSGASYHAMPSPGDVTQSTDMLSTDREVTFTTFVKRLHDVCFYDSLCFYFDIYSPDWHLFEVIDSGDLFQESAQCLRKSRR